ncbi:MAG: nonstructural protein [Arizlama microvirus]|nr:MAG: nonstructural protein [Arizlama microvirus]
MKLKLFVVYDAKTESYGVPFFRDFTANALREWSEVASAKSDKNNQISKFPADFTLFEIGEFDQMSGIVRMYESKYNLGLAVEHIKQDFVPQN